MNYNFEVREEDILETYVGDEISAAQNYKRVMGSNHQGAPAIAAALGMRVEKVRRYLSGMKPRGIKGLDQLEAYGLFPVDLHSENFDLFHILSCMAYWRGVVVSRNEGDATMANTVLNPTSLAQQAFMKAFLAQSQIPCRTISKGGLSVPNEISRLLVAAGHEVGMKSDNTSTIPKYIEDAIKACEVTGDSNAVALVREFIQSMVFFRLKKYPEASMVHLFTLHDEGSARLQGELIHRAVRIGLPEVSTELRGPYSSDGTFHTRIAFPTGNSLISSIRDTYAEEAFSALHGS